MDWKSLISELQLEFRLTQPQIAAACRCGQSTISDIAKGNTTDPRHSLGEALKALLHEKRSERAASKDAPSQPPASPPAAAGHVDTMERRRITDVESRAAAGG